jgi:hypothetical protein
VLVTGEPTPATTPDEHRGAVSHAALAPRALWPAEHGVDKGDTAADGRVARQQTDDVAIVGPGAEAPSWQARTGEGFDTSPLLVDGERRVVTDPAGQPRLSGWPNTDPKHGRG